MKRNDYLKEKLEAVGLFEFITENSKPAIPNTNEKIAKEIIVDYKDGLFMLLNFKERNIIIIN